MRSFTKDVELIRPAITRFAITFLTLQSIYKQKQPLQILFSSEAWCSNQWAKMPKVIKAHTLVLFDPHFGGHLAYYIRSVVPLVSVQRQVYSEDRLVMGYIYELMDSAKKNCFQFWPKWNEIWTCLEKDWFEMENLAA